VRRRRRTVEISRRIYRALLVAYPREFREEYGAQLEQSFGDLCREEAGQGGLTGLAGLWVRVLRDLASAAAVERMAGREIGTNGEVAVMERRLAWVGFVLLAPPLFFVTASLLKYELGVGFLFGPLEALMAEPARRHVFNLVSPVVFLGGLCLALALNAYAVLRLNVARERGALVGVVRIEIKALNVAVAASSLLLLATLVGYSLLEHFVYRP
jgi:hypothetical protein